MQPQEQVKVEEKNVQQQTEQVIAQPTQQTKEESPPIKSEENKKNWAEFRAQREIERKAKEEADRRAEQKAAEAEALRQALEALTNKPANNHQINQPYPQDIEESEEEKIERKVQEAIKREREKFEKERKEREHQETPLKLRQHFSDFDKVCTTENLDYLEYHYPEVAAPYAQLPDSYEKWAAVYKAVKRFVPNPDSHKDAQKIEKNLSKPASISAPGVAQGGTALSSSMLSEERKAANWQRMQRAMKGLS